jgi:hypothetical protein
LVYVAIGAAGGLLLVGGGIGDLLTTGVMPHVFIGDVMSQWGAPGPSFLIGDSPLLIPDQIWAALNGLGLVATILVPATFTGMIGNVLRNGGVRGALTAARKGSPAWLLIVFASGMALGVTTFGLLGLTFDRYLWPLVPPLATVLLAFRPAAGEHSPAADANSASGYQVRAPQFTRAARGATVAGLFLALVLGATSLAMLFNSAAFDAAKWRAGEALVAAGIPAESIDAGFEWVGYHVLGPADFAHGAPGLTWYETWWPSFRLCGVVASVPQNLQGEELVRIDTEAYRLLLFAGDEEPLYFYRIHGPGCP